MSYVLGFLLCCFAGWLLLYLLVLPRLMTWLAGPKAHSLLGEPFAGVTRFGSWTLLTSLYTFMVIAWYVAVADRIGTDLWLYLGMLAIGLAAWFVRRAKGRRESAAGLYRAGRAATLVGVLVALGVFLLALRSNAFREWIRSLPRPR